MKQLPPELLNDLESIKGFNQQSFLEAHANAQQITSIRLNKNKLTQFALTAKPVHPEFNLKNQVPWCEDGFYLNERPAFTLDPLLHAGAYYVHEASSMFLQEVLKQTCDCNAEYRILDLCAAPGGKSSLLASYFKKGLLVSNEILKQRASILYENLTKWGAVNVVVTNNNASDFKRLENYFDVIVIDAPCSGSGLFRKDENAINEWSLNNVALCSQRQQKILADVYSSLKQNGILIYSTCSYSKQENENILDWIIDNFNTESIQLTLKDEWSIIETQSDKHKAFGYRFWPDKIKGEGFFISVLKKKDGGLFYHQSPKNNLSRVSNKESAITLNYLDEATNFFLFKQNEIIYAVEKKWMNDISLLQKNFYLRKAGIQTGTIKHEELIPHHELALSTIIKNTIQKIELTRDESLQYLRKKEINFASDCKGWALSTYNNYPLGWMKFLHNRVNNYYPTEWRILKD